MPLKIGKLIERVRSWFPEAQSTIKAQAADFEAKLVDLEIKPLSPEQKAQFQRKIDALGSPQPHQKVLTDRLTEAITRWLSTPQSANHLVVLGSPIESPAQVIHQQITNWNNPDLHVQTLAWTTRPYDCSTMRQKLQDDVGSCQLAESDPQQAIAELPDDRPSLIVIPDLSWCFLRCVEGLEGIEYIFDLILEDRSRFWLVGCNHWTWQYFGYVFQANRRLENTLVLPPLNELELKHQLAPLMEMADFQIGVEKDDHHSDSQSNDSTSEWASEAEKRYFDHLMDISLGLNRVAAQLWLGSLGYVIDEADEEGKTDENEPSGQHPHDPAQPITLKQATLPDLPDLTKADRYLLYSLGLHGGMRLADLALSLGDLESDVKAQVQALWRSGVILRQQELWVLNPRYYPRLRRDLDHNQILVGDNY